jgi:hypothetical protein
MLLWDVKIFLISFLVVFIVFKVSVMGYVVMVVVVTIFTL